MLGARRTENSKARVEDITTSGGEAIAKTLDVRDKGSIAGFLDSAYEQYGRLDCVINNAGVEAGAKTYHTIDEDDWDLSSTLTLSRRGWSTSSIPDRVVAHKQDGGNIIMISSITDSRTIKTQFPTPFQRAA